MNIFLFKYNSQQYFFLQNFRIIIHLESEDGLNSTQLTRTEYYFFLILYLVLKSIALQGDNEILYNNFQEKIYFLNQSEMIISQNFIKIYFVERIYYFSSNQCQSIKPRITLILFFSIDLLKAFFLYL
ncbi:hypothetical protein pb186bvf_004910 [Paramecium bursaria]